MKICIARLRSGINYTEPLNDIIDPFYEMLRLFVSEYKDTYTFSYYNFGLGAKPKRDLEAVKNADYIIIPSEAEFQYHIPGFIHTLDKKSSDNNVKLLQDNIKSTAKIIILQYDQKDTVELYTKYTFPGLKNKIIAINETHFRGSISFMRYWFIKDYLDNYEKNPLVEEPLYEKKYDFCYYGCDKRKDVGGIKSEDLRYTNIKQARKDNRIKTFYIGRFAGIETDMKFNRDIKKLLPFMCQSRATLCFNWPGFSNHVTARYGEALGCRMIPLVWSNYDIGGILTVDEWQRCKDYEDFVGKLIELQDNTFFEKKITEITKKVLETRIETPEQYYKVFKEKILNIII